MLKPASAKQKMVNERIVHKLYHNQSGDWDVAYINRTSKINVNGILIEYEGEDSGIGLLFASKAAVQVGYTISIDCCCCWGGWRWGWGRDPCKELINAPNIITMKQIVHITDWDCFWLLVTGSSALVTLNSPRLKLN